MKICYIADASSVHTQRWVNYFADRGDETHLISSRDGEGYVSSVHFHRLTTLQPQLPVLSKYLDFLVQMIQVRKLVRMIQPDILHAHHIAVNGYLGVVSGFHPLIFTAWGSDILIHPRKNRVWRMLTRYALKKADSITCDADHIVEAIIKLGANPEKIHLIYFGTDIQKFRPQPRNNGLRETLGLGDSPVVISLRNLIPIYNVESLINAMPLVLKEIPEAKFIIAGDGKQRVYLEGLAKSLGASESARFVGGISNDKLPEYLTSADIYVSTSLSDAGLAASTAEAMACGLPVIVTDFGDNRKWVEDEVNGFIVPLHDPAALASRINYLLHKRDDRIRFGQAGRQIIEERNNHEKQMEKAGELYEQLIVSQKMKTRGEK